MRASLLAIMLGSALFAASAAAQQTAASPSPQSEKLPPIVGLGQDSAKEPPMLKNLRLNDPVVQKKFQAEPDLLRFLRATYSEACVRGLLNTAMGTIREDTSGKYDAAAKDTAKKLAEGRIWKMSSFEMEAIFGAGYVRGAFYCDCLMKELSDADMVNPRKGLEVVEKISPSAQSACERLSQEKLERYQAQNKPPKDRK